MKNPQKLPRRLYRFFWDVSAETIDPKKNSQYVIERILEFGDAKALRWIQDNFAKKILKEIVKKNKRISKKTANYFSLIYHIPKTEITCLQEGFRNKHRRIWKF
ncbi:hypothetical protein HY612_04450 [Candidatus Roizmanbacteria bacterium]|nr:hypothetical protein [Candidatus Roizmanbacteria bacterium]